MNNTSTVDTTAGGPGQRSRLRKILDTFSKHWLYIGLHTCSTSIQFYLGFAIILAIVNLLLGILTLSYLHPKKEALLFGIVCLGILLALGHFASLCYLIQRAKDELSDPTLIDAAISCGLVFLFAISGAALTYELPSRCYSGPNEHFKVIGRNCCTSITTMAVSSWLAVLLMIVATTIIFFAARKAIEISKLPPPVFPSGAEAPVMRWLDRNDPFLAVSERRQHHHV